MSASSHGLPDSAIRDAHDMIHHAEQEEHEHEAASRRGLTDEAAEAEYDLIHGAEERLAKKHTHAHRGKMLRTLEKMMPGKH
ncbi:hypothetical protein F5B20DRAFT_534992 [Whalleya microplaca]|nr:hypothetical protein F5B20DRAFT_534992 [Whalleya microplaca]